MIISVAQNTGCKHPNACTLPHAADTDPHDQQEESQCGFFFFFLQSFFAWIICFGSNGVQSMEMGGNSSVIINQFFMRDQRSMNNLLALQSYRAANQSLCVSMRCLVFLFYTLSA